MNRLILFIVCLCLVLHSCRASRHNRTEDHSSYDSAKVVTNDSTHVRKDQSTQQQVNDKVEEGYIDVELEFQTDTIVNKSAIDRKVDSTVAEDNILEWLEIALESPRIKSARIKGKLLRTDNSKTTTQNNITDSTVRKTGDSTSVGKETIHTDDNTEREQFSVWKLLPWYVWLIIAVILFLVIRYLYRRYIPNFLKPKKNENSF
ncbi:MAG: hypothetical protein ACTHMM_17730 [Agriterribacter sp.]